MTTSRVADPADAPSPGHRASWPDRLADRVEALPGPAWCYYLATSALLFGVGVLLARLDFGDAAQFGVAVRYQGAFLGLLTYMLILKHYLRTYSRVAMRSFRPVYREEDSLTGQKLPFAEAVFKLANTPARPTLLWTLAGVFLVAVLMVAGLAPFQRLGIAPAPVSFLFNVVLELALWAVLGSGIYFVVSTLRLVARLYARHAQVSLFRQQPLYAFSALTVRYALSALIGPSIFNLLEPILLASFITAAITAAGVVASLILFVGPLFGAHRLLVAEKNTLLAENAERLRAALDRLHAEADDGDMTRAANIEHLLAGLQNERNILEATRTWPWRPDLFRAFLTALFLPMTIWLVQFLLARVLK